MTSEEFILEIHSTEDITSADYLKAVVEKCLQSLNNGEEVVTRTKTSEAFNVEVITPDQVVESEQEDNVENYIDFDEYMVNEVVICESDDSESPGQSRSKEDSAADRFVEFDRGKKENEVVESFKNDHIYHHIYQPDREYSEQMLSPQSYVTILDDNIEIVETEIKTKKGRKKLRKNISGTSKTKKKSDSDVEGDDESDPADKVKTKRKIALNKNKKDSISKSVKEPKPLKDQKIVKVTKPLKVPKQPRIKKEKIQTLPKRAKPNNEIVIKKADGEDSVATASNIADPAVQAAIRTLKEGNKENDNTVITKNVYSIYDPEGKVILPFLPKKYNEAMPFWCDECEFKTGTRQRLKLHKLRKHGGVKQYQCCECSYSAHDAYSVRVHYGNMHQDTKKFQCDQCNFACNYKAGLKKHINKAHGTKKPYQCSKCGYEQYNITILKQHIQSVHMGILPYSCRFCDKKFIDERRMLLHVKRLHYRVKRFRCAKCNFSAFTKCEVKKHLFSHHLDMATIQCSKCSYSTKSRQELAQHIKRVHRKLNGPKPINGHNCQFCDISLHLKSDLIAHMQNFHGITKTFQCDMCNFVTFDYDPLKRHIKENHNPDALKCKNCNFTTMHAKSLKEHKKTHADNVTFPCRFCNASFRYKMCLTKHEVAKHGRELREEPQDDMNTTYEKKWISYDQSNAETTCELITDGNSQTVTYVGVNNLTNIELDKLIADTVADEQDTEQKDQVKLERAIASYLCTVCNIVFQDKDILNWHINRHQVENKFKQLALNKSNIVPKMSAEMIEVLQRKYVTCTLCGYAEDRLDLLVYHMLADHFNCDIPLSKRRNEGDTRDKASKLAAPSPSFVCDMCEFTTSSKAAFESHKEVCADDHHYVIPCEIVISEDINSIIEMSPDENEDGTPRFRTVPAKRKIYHRSGSKGYARPWRRRRYSRNYISSDDDDSVSNSKRRTFNCPECIFVCDRKRVMAHHFINSHISTPRQQLNVIDMKLSLNEKLGVKLKPPEFRAFREEEDSEDIDNPEDGDSGTNNDPADIKEIKFTPQALFLKRYFSDSDRERLSSKIKNNEAECERDPRFRGKMAEYLDNFNKEGTGIQPLLLRHRLSQKLAQIKTEFDERIDTKCGTTETLTSRGKPESPSKTVRHVKPTPTCSKFEVDLDASDDTTPSLRAPSSGKRQIKRPSRYDDGIDPTLGCRSPVKKRMKNSGGYRPDYKTKESEEGSDCDIIETRKEPARYRETAKRCSKCDVRLGSVEALNMHTILAHGFSILLTCSYCCFTTMKKKVLKRHVTDCFLANS